MSESHARTLMAGRLREAAERDPRIVGLVEYGSGAEGRADEWSDLDLALFIRDDDFDAFARDWAVWAAQFGELLLAYVGRYGHPWAVYDARPLPLRVDFDLHRASQPDDLLREYTRPLSAEAMVWYDGGGGALLERAQRLVGRSLWPADAAATFAQVCGDFWYFLLYVFSKLQRGEQWVARQVYYCEVVEPLLRLLRLEAGALDYWRGAPAAADVERALLPERLARLDICVPAAGAEELRRVLRAAAELGTAACAGIAAQHGWPWPQTLAARTAALLQDARG